MSARRNENKETRATSRAKPEVDHVSPELKALLGTFTDEEITTGEVRPPEESSVGGAMTADEIEAELGTAILEEDLAALLRKARTSKKLSLKEVGQRLRVSKTRVHQLEEKDANLEVATLCRVADALGYDVMVTFTERKEGKSIAARMKGPPTKR